jgi:hypothetical protein
MLTPLNNSRVSMTVVNTEVNETSELGSANNPHRVDEGRYIHLKGSDVDQHIVVPRVSGCAAIKCSVMSGYDREGNDKVSQSFTLHSDGLAKSKQRANEIGNAIQQKSGESISVSILMITNGYEYFPPAKEHMEVVGNIRTKLEDKNIPCVYQSKVLNGVQSRIDIDMSGTDEEICTHYQGAFRPMPTKEQREFNIERYKEYIQKYNTEAGARKMNQATLPTGRRLRRQTNPDYFEPLDRQQWLYFVDNQQIKREFQRLDDALQNYDNKCGCTIF